MPVGTKIEWTEATWNPVTGCTPVSAGCEHCYAKRIANRHRGRFGYPADEPFRVTLHGDRLNEPRKWRKPRMVFVCSMGDLFHEAVPAGFIEAVWRTMAGCPQHIFQVLTKRPQRMAEWGTWSAALPHVWLGVTAENRVCLNERLPHLLNCPAAVRFLSIEPMLEPIRLELAGIGWVIFGCESGPKRRACDLGWIRDGLRQCRVSGAPAFVKQVEHPFGRMMKDPAEWPEDLRVREWPACRAVMQDKPEKAHGN